MAACNDLRLGGTLAGSGLSGGLSINSTALAVRDWSGLLGHSGVAYTPATVEGRPGGWLTGDGLGKARLMTLNMNITRWGPALALVEPDASQQLVANTDDFLSLLADKDGNYLELDMPDGSKRFQHVTALDPASIRQVTNSRSIGVPLWAEWPYWSAGGTESTDTIAAGDTMVIGGNVNVYDAVLVFAGNGAFTNTTEGWTLTIAGASGAVTVDLGERTVTQASIAADQLLTRTDREWGWFSPGNNSVTSNVSVVVTWRNQFAQ